MLSHLRRILLVIIIFVFVGWLYQTWREDQGGYGLFNVVRGEKGTSDTPQVLDNDGPKLTETELPSLASLSEESAKLAAAVLPCVVSINTESAVATRPRNIQEFMQGYGVARQRGLGSGALVSKEGHVLTNFHVVANARQIQITTDEHKTFAAEVVGVDQPLDLALLRIISNRKDFPALSFANSDNVKVGQIVFAVGNPLGFSGTVTQGIISATQRWTQDSNMEFLQTDTVIIPGNSGGPLVNIRGEIIGINESIYTGGGQTQAQHAWQGIGLAIPANDAKESLEAMLAKRQRVATFLGLQLEPSAITVNSAEGASLGVMVTFVGPDTPAQASGLKVGDVIIQFGGRRVESATQLLSFIRRAKAGQPVDITVIRKGEMEKLTAIPQPRPVDPQGPQGP